MKKLKKKQNECRPEKSKWRTQFAMERVFCKTIVDTFTMYIIVVFSLFGETGMDFYSFKITYSTM